MANIQTTLQILVLPCFCMLFSVQVQSQIVPDATLGNEASTVNPNTSVNNQIVDLINGGSLQGNNLFHSFEQFNIQNGQSVYFANPSGVVNILTRVTGASKSNILGTLGVNGNANLVLINPNGIFFGENARLDIRSSFIGSTANGIEFGEQGVFSTVNPQSPPLLTVNPSALLFNQINRNAAIQNNSIAPAGQDLSGEDVFGLRVPNGKSLLLVGSDVTMNGGQVNAIDGRIELGGLAAPGKVNLNLEGDNFQLDFPENTPRGNVFLTNRSRIFVTGAGQIGDISLVNFILGTNTSPKSGGAGNIAINAENIEISQASQLSAGITQGLDSSFISVFQPLNTGGDIVLNATGNVVITDSESGINNLVRSDSQGIGGNISIDANSLLLGNGAQIATSVLGIGIGGNTNINTKQGISANNAAIFSTIEAGGLGFGGDINVNAGELQLKNGAQILTTIRAASGNRGSAQGAAGNANINVSGIMDIAGVQDGVPSGVRSDVETQSGDAGNIRINTGSLKLRDGGVITTSHFGDTGLIGQVGITARDKVDIENASIFSTLKVGEPGSSSQFFLFTGIPVTPNVDIENVGNISIDSPQIILDNQGQLNTDSISGLGGNIRLNSDLLQLRNGSKISANAGTQTTGGDGGNIDIDTKFVVATPNQDNDITANAFQGRGGNINIKAERIFGIEKAIAPVLGRNDITASSNINLPGEVIIEEPDVDIVQGIIELPQQVVDNSEKVGEICPRTPEDAANLSEFTVTGRGNLPPSPLEPLSGSQHISLLATLDNRPRTSISTNNQARNHTQQQPQEIVEAQSWVRNLDGKIQLVAIAFQIPSTSSINPSKCNH